MKVEIKGYTPEYKEGVLKCLKDNYPWMAKVSDDALYDWAKPFLEYKWQEDLPEDVKTFQHGMLFISSNKVVGFLGFIFARRQWQGHDYIYQNGTTWAVDKGYRIYLFRALKQADALADVLGDFTPVKAVEETLVKVFKYRYIDHYVYQFDPFPCFHETLDYEQIESADELSDPVLKVEFQDHSPYGVRCLRIGNGQEESYILFRVNKRIRKNRKIFRKRRSVLKILKLTNPDFFCDHYREIVWHLQKGEHPHVMLEARFIAPRRIHGFRIKEKKVVRLGLDKTGLGVPIDSLYSEEAILP